MNIAVQIAVVTVRNERMRNKAVRTIERETIAVCPGWEFDVDIGVVVGAF